MKKQMYKLILLINIFLLSSGLMLQAQCPGCITDMNFIISPAAPGITPDTLPDGEAGLYYDADVNFYLPAEFTHSSGTDVTLTKLEVLSVSGLPFGLSFQSSSVNNTFFPSQNPPATEHGCAKICGTPVFSGQYNMVVFVRAYVNTIIGNQTSDDSFTIPIKILPGSSGNASFSIINSTGCGSVTASFQTNLPSNGTTGYSYDWNFGNGFSSTSETPPDMTYSNPGQYSVICNTTIDTLSFNYLNTVSVLGTSCSDFLGTPDLYIIVKNQSGTTLHQTSCVLDTDPPVSFTLPGIQLYHNQNYSIEVWDEDGGLAGEDDHCKTFTIPGTSNSNTLWSGSDGISFVTTRPVLTFNDTATITVYPQPANPVITATPTNEACVNDSILLSASNATNYQWFNDTSLILGAIQQNMYVLSSGKYFVRITDNNGCEAQSDTSHIEFHNNPPKPTFWKQGDTLHTLLSGFNLQWYLNGDPINGANSQICFIAVTGYYSLSATSAYGCHSVSDAVYYQASASGFEAENNSIIQDFVLYPNPSNGTFTVKFGISNAVDIKIRLYNMLGQELYKENLLSFSGLYEKLMDLKLNPSVYVFEIKASDNVLLREKIIIK